MGLFANAFYILDLDNNNQSKADGPFKTVDDINISENSFIQTLMYVYLISNGEYGTDGYEKAVNQQLTWIVFLVASIVLQLVLMNMIIAIMADTYAKIMDKKEHYNLGVCPNIYADYFDVIK